MLEVRTFQSYNSKVMTRFYISLVVIAAISATCNCATNEDVHRLFKDVMNKSNPNIRPLKNQSHRVDVELTIDIVAITDVNEVAQKVEATVWVSVKWKNELLTWNKSEYGDLEVVNPPTDIMWRPDISISNGYNELSPLGLDFVIMKSVHTGRTIWWPGQRVEFLCSIDVTQFPFDTQHCYMDFFNWGGTAKETTLKYAVDPERINQTEGTHANSEWALIGRKYEKLKNKAHDTVRFTLTLRRKSLSMVLNILLPVFLLSFLNVFVFLLPIQSGEKLSFAVTVLLSQAVFLSYISGLLPQTSDSISGLSIYISIQLVLSTLYVLLTCLILCIYHRDTTNRPLPNWLFKLYCLGGSEDISLDEKMLSNKSAHVISEKLDRTAFWVFLLVVVLMTANYLITGLQTWQKM